MPKKVRFLLGLVVLLFLFQCSQPNPSILSANKDSRIVLIGNNLCSRMINYGHFETEMHLRFPDSTLFIRNMCDGGNTPGFRPHSGRPLPWAFPGAEKESPLRVRYLSGAIQPSPERFFR